MLRKTILGLSILLVFLVPVYAWTDQASIAECERQNLVYGCSCDCRNEGKLCVASTKKCEVPTVVTQNINDVLHVVDIFPVGSGLLIYSGNQLNIPATITNLLKWVFFILAFLAVILGLYGAFKYSTAQADDDQVAEAQKIMRNALIGFVIALAAAIIVTYVSRLLGFAQ